MKYDQKLIDRQVGRNAQLFAQSIADLDSREERYPYLRILISIVEQAHPEWNQAPHKDEQITELIQEMCEGVLEEDEIVEIIHIRDREQNGRG